MSMYICNINSLEQKIISLNTEINHFANKANTFSVLKATNNLNNCLNNITQYYQNCSTNLKNIQDYLNKYYLDLSTFEDIASCNRYGSMQEAPYSIGVQMKDSTLLDNYDFNWVFPFNASSFNASTYAKTTTSFTVTDTSSIKWKVVGANVAVAVLNFGEGVLNETEELMDFGISAVGFFADKLGQDETALWCKDAVSLDISKEIIKDSIQDYKDLGFDIERYADTDGTLATVSSMVGSVALGYLLNNQIANLSSTKATMLVNGLYDGTQAYGRTMESEFNNGANWNQASLLSLASAGINFGAGELRGKISKGFGQKGVITAKEIIGKSLLCGGISAVQPAATKIMDTALYENNGSFNGLADFFTQLSNNMANDGTYQQMLINGITSAASTAHAGFNYKGYNEEYSNSGKLNVKDNYLRYIEDFKEDPIKMYQENLQYFQDNKISIGQFLKSVIASTKTNSFDGLQLKNEILTSAKVENYDDPILKAKALYNSLNERVSYDFRFTYNGGQFQANDIAQQMYNNKVSFDNLTSSEVVCKGWSELYQDLLISSGFPPDQVRLNSSQLNLDHKYVFIDLDEKTTIICDGTRGKESDLYRAKVGQTSEGFIVVSRSLADGADAKGYFPAGANMVSIEDLDSQLGIVSKSKDVPEDADELFNIKNILKDQGENDYEILKNCLWNIEVPENLSGDEAHKYIKDITGSLIGENSVKNYIDSGLYTQSLYINPSGSPLCVMKFDEGEETLYEVIGKEFGKQFYSEKDFNSIIKALQYKKC